jgi:hydroxyethylthiazole kinase
MMMHEELLTKVRTLRPLVHHITNFVTAGDCANMTLAIGALPVMTSASSEVEEMVRGAQALVLNIGTLTEEQVQAMIRAGRVANTIGIPVILDPVGAGATTVRTEAAMQLLHELKISVVKGNSAEIAVLAGKGGIMRGVESAGQVENASEAAAILSNRYKVVAAVSGKTDIITDGKRLAYVDNGHPMMTTITGTGCMLSSVVGSFCGVEQDCFEASVAAFACYGLAGELAAARSDVRGPGSFKTAFFDEIYDLTEEKIRQGARIRPSNVLRTD